jgi:signal transduction histidine kinase
MIEGDPIDLTPGIDLVGYRVIEAAVALIVRGHGSLATVTIGYTTDWVELEVRGDTRIPDVERELSAISERVALYDGSLASASGSGDTFSVRARLPLGAAISA